MGKTSLNWISAGQKFGQWTVTGKSVVINRSRNWECRCDCGTVKFVQQYALHTGGSLRCSNHPRQIIHGQYTSRTYRAYRAMVSRCLNPNVESYPNYGGRGITICERWLKCFENFYADMGDIPAKMSLDRKDNNLGYSKDNCRWATQKEQQNNRRSNVRLTYDGLTLTITQWAERQHINQHTMQQRYRRGWDVEAILTTPPGPNGKKKAIKSFISADEQMRYRAAGGELR